MADYLLLLPSDMLMNILSRLPLETIIRCTCVCKSWYSLVTSPDFITTHLLNNNNNGSSQLLVTHCTNTPKKISCSIYHDNNESFEECAKFDFPITLTGAKFKIIGSVNGLVLYSLTEKYGTFICLWNPFIRKCLTLPGITLNSYYRYRYSIGFGFDPLRNDYKIVKVVYPLNHSDFNVLLEVELYELSTRSWRGISAGEILYCIKKDAQQAFVNGVVHWIGHDLKSFGGIFCNSIVSFDMKTESFGTMMVPLSLEKQQGMSVAVVGESLSLTHTHTSFFTCCVWVMKGYGTLHSWTKKFEIELGFRGPYWGTVGFRSNGDVLMTIMNGDLVSYDPESHKIKNLGINRGQQSFYIDNYMESLVLVEGLYGVLERKGKSFLPYKRTKYSTSS